jgi:hypothetical protein
MLYLSISLGPQCLLSLLLAFHIHLAKEGTRVYGEYAVPNMRDCTCTMKQMVCENAKEK